MLCPLVNLTDIKSLTCKTSDVRTNCLRRLNNCKLMFYYSEVRHSKSCCIDGPNNSSINPTNTIHNRNVTIIVSLINTTRFINICQLQKCLNILRLSNLIDRALRDPVVTYLSLRPCNNFSSFDWL